MRISVEVDGRPPKKHGEKSMWARNDEAPLVARLRRRALEERVKAGLSKCPRVRSLELVVYAPAAKLEGMGDLDSFVTGICDGLQAAMGTVLPFLHPVFSEPGNEDIHPTIPLLIENDAQITTIVARKLPAPAGGGVSYKVVVTVE
jgi:hypothetical protein